MSDLFSTGHGLDAAASWRDAISRAFVPLEFSVDDRSSFAGAIRQDRIGAIALSHVRASTHRVMRSARAAGSAGSGYLKLSMPLAGTATVVQDDREAVLTAGDMAVYDTSRPYELLDRSGNMLVVLVAPRTLGLPSAALKDLTARPIAGHCGVGAVVGSMLTSLAESLPTLPDWQAARVSDHFLGLISTMCLDAATQAGFGPDEPAALVFNRAVSFIESHLHDSALTPHDIASGCFVSTGYLHKVFRRESVTVSTLVRRMRLDRARRILLDPGRSAVPVAVVGDECGFVDAAHFSRVFKSEFGTSPREFRRQVTGSALNVTGHPHGAVG